MGSRTGKGINVQRKLTSSRSSITSEIRDLQTSIPPAILYRAVVVEVFNDLSLLSEDTISILADVVSNPTFIDDMPRNTIVARIISDASDRRGSSPILCFPFFPPYLCMPIKAGEQVWIMFENPIASRDMPWWLFRISEPNSVDDINYTHGDRKFDADVEVSTSEKADVLAGKKFLIPKFNNGAGTSNSFSLSRESDYEDIVDLSSSYESFTPETVPRYTKRSGDFVVQGSNNAILILGEDRVGSATKGDDEKKTGAGSADLVVGRGRFMPKPEVFPEEPNSSENASWVVENERGNFEVDKTVRIKGLEDNVKEGDPSFKDDSSRLYVCMKSDVDVNFNIETSNMPISFENEITDVSAAACAVLKSDEIRIIARKNSDKNINGSIRLIKEGDVGEDQAAFLLLPDGTVRLDGNKIFLGRPGGKGPGASGSEPYVKFSELKNFMNNTFSILNTLFSSLSLKFASNVSPGFGNPNPQVAASSADFESAKASLNILIQEIDSLQSSRIFGE